MSAAFDEGSPGYSIPGMLRSGSEAFIRALIGSPAVDILRTLDTRFFDLGTLRTAAASLIDGRRALDDPSDRASILGALPIGKARELCRRLGVEAAGDVYATLSRQDLGKAAAKSALNDFFGLDDDGAPAGGKPIANTAVVVAYGLFDHQRRAASRTLEALGEPPRKALLHMPTGAGKTRTAMHVVARHLTAREPSLVCWLAQSRELLEQAADEFERCWRHLGSHEVPVVRFWGDGALPAETRGSSFLVMGFAKLQALMKRDFERVLRIADATTLVVVDEAHQAVAPSYRDAIETLSRKRPDGALLGLSATPGRTWDRVDIDRRLSAFFAERKVTIEIDGYDDPVSYLVERGYLARPVFRTLNAEPGMVLAPADVAALAEGLEVPETVLDALAEDQRRNVRILAEVESLAARHARTIVFATTVAHARLLATVTTARGLEAAVVTGDMPKADRERAIARFRGSDPRPMVMYNFGVLTTGFDAPTTSAAIIARPTRSLVLYSQMVGRATRGVRAGGNERAEIVTVVDPALTGFGDMSAAFANWEDVWDDKV